VRALQLVLLVVLALPGGCTHREPAQRQVAEPSGQADVSVSPAASAKPGRATLALTLTVERTPQGVGLHVVNRGSERVELASAVSAASRGAGVAAVAQALSLRLDCKGRQACLALDPGSELLAPSWLGQIEAERCDALFQPQHAGEYELVVKACRGDAEARVRFHWDPP
jgi:hypothetical protein